MALVNPPTFGEDGAVAERTGRARRRTAPRAADEAAANVALTDGDGDGDGDGDAVFDASEARVVSDAT